MARDASATTSGAVESVEAVERTTEKENSSDRLPPNADTAQPFRSRADERERIAAKGDVDGNRTRSDAVPATQTEESGPVVPEGREYARPSGYRAGVRDQVWEGNRQEDTGQVRDPQTGRFMDQEKPWDMGHRPGFEFRKHQESAINRGISRQEFLDEHNDPSHYRPELPSSNRNRRSEDVTDDYFGD